MIEYAFERWTLSLQQAFSLARAERLHQLRGTYSKRFDGAGLHPYSLAWGEVMACESVFPELSVLRLTGETSCDPVSMRSVASADAERQFAREIINEARGEL